MTQSMRSKAEERSLRDILYHIDLASSFIAGFDRDTFKSDLRTLYAVTRCLEIISEASRRLRDDLKARHPPSRGSKWRAQGMLIVTTMRTWPRSSCGTPCSALCRHCATWWR